ncbi:hypothetical protein OEA41_004029 [Lepraria neglecta]|uniref:Uncharacterized protein n=1 Tax=Lepraria neglecta TaxID=209136 RepID=A0AAD9Z5T1_9LECA|nr:hypothetical protein OEA41_004029 [Lepraria neglecta]
MARDLALTYVFAPKEWKLRTISHALYLPWISLSFLGAVEKYRWTMTENWDWARRVRDVILRRPGDEQLAEGVGGNKSDAEGAWRILEDYVPKGMEEESIFDGGSMSAQRRDER